MGNLINDVPDNFSEVIIEPVRKKTSILDKIKRAFKPRTQLSRSWED